MNPGILLGDDDLVSPVVAAASDAKVTVVDIDTEVLARARRVAHELEAEILTVHADISAGALNLPVMDIVVCDPYPSGDGSFEAFFWRQAISCLRPGGLLITTVAPSHKPERYAWGALTQLEKLSLHLIDLKADFGCYEVFDFELSDIERSILGDIGGICEISHTKSLLTARLGFESTTRPATGESDIDFERWTSAALSHYLTQQAGVARQANIAELRGPSAVSAEGAPGDFSGATSWMVTADLVERITPYLPAGRQSELASFRGAQAIDSNEFSLVLRAIESWERWRLDG